MNDHIKARLDRGLVFASFSQLFPTFSVCTTLVNHADHLALSIHLFQNSNSCTRRKSKLKRFDPHWMKEEECLEFFYKLWSLDPNPWADYVRTNFKLILEHLLDWSKKKFGHLPICIKKVRQQFDNLRY